MILSLLYAAADCRKDFCSYITLNISRIPKMFRINLQNCTGMSQAIERCGMCRQAHRQIFVDVSMNGNIALPSPIFDHLDSAGEHNTCKDSVDRHCNGRHGVTSLQNSWIYRSCGRSHLIYCDMYGEKTGGGGVCREYQCAWQSI